MEPTTFHFARFHFTTVRTPCAWFVVAILLLVQTRIAHSEQKIPDSSTTNSRVDQLERKLQSVVEENRRLS